MKQRITLEQLKELTEEQRQKLQEWWQPQYGDMFHYKGSEHVIDGDYWAISDISKIRDKLPNTFNGLPLLSIGQMIELLCEYANGKKIDMSPIFRPIGWEVYFDIMVEGKGAEFRRGEASELCDALWEAVKEVL